MKTNLKDVLGKYQPRKYSFTYKDVLYPGDLCITLDHPRGYCVEVLNQSKDGQIVKARFLDDASDSIQHYTFDSLVQTGKTTLDLLSLYEPSDQEFARALEDERSVPNFQALKKSTSKTSKKKPKQAQTLSDDTLKQLIKQDPSILKKILQNLKI